MRDYITVFSRFFVGILFIFSGLIKLNDPVGTAIKMEEYIEVFAADFSPFLYIFLSSAVAIAMIIIILEVVLGVAVLLHYQMRITTWGILSLVIFFAFLTFYSAYFNKVTDCGCFGDAIKLTPWQSFYKDVILLVFVLHLFWYRKTHKSPVSMVMGHTIVGSTLIISLSLGVYAIRHLPFIDFRAYKVGNNIPEQMIPEEQPIIEYVFKKDEKTVTSTQFLTPDSGYTYMSSHVLNPDKIIPKITDYNVTNQEGHDVTQDAFQGVKFFIIIQDVQKAGTDNMNALRNLIKHLDGKADCLILTSSVREQVEVFRHENQLAVPYYYSDATVLKTIVRSNPGTTLWKNGTVLGKWHHRNTPTIEEIDGLL